MIRRFRNVLAQVPCPTHSGFMKKKRETNCGHFRKDVYMVLVFCDWDRGDQRNRFLVALRLCLLYAVHSAEGAVRLLKFKKIWQAFLCYEDVKEEKLQAFEKGLQGFFMIKSLFYSCLFYL